LEQVIACAGVNAGSNPQAHWQLVVAAATDILLNGPGFADACPALTCGQMLEKVRNAYLNACGSCPDAGYCLGELNHPDNICDRPAPR